MGIFQIFTGSISPEQRYGCIDVLI